MSDTTSPQEERPRRPRGERAEDNLPGFRPGPRDPELIEYVYNFRFLTTDHLAALTGGDYTSVRKRLRKLYDHGYLDRLWDPPENPRQAKAVYVLDRKGADVLVEQHGNDPSEFNWRSDRDDVKRDKLQHALMIAHIRAVVTLAARARPSVQLVNWKNDSKEIHDWVPLADDDPVYKVPKGQRRESVPVRPDSFFQLRWPGAQGNVMQGNFMLEADRGTMDRQDYKNKLRAYWLWYRAGKHREEKFGITRFVVLTVTLNKKRAQDLFKLSKDVDDRGTGSAMFWFTTLEQLKLDDPERVFKDIWLTWDKGNWAKAALVK